MFGPQLETPPPVFEHVPPAIAHISALAPAPCAGVRYCVLHVPFPPDPHPTTMAAAMLNAAPSQ